MKSYYPDAPKEMVSVAPFAGAWIEILIDAIKSGYLSSLPSRERGLKYNLFKKNERKVKSLPSRERGLKF